MNSLKEKIESQINGLKREIDSIGRILNSKEPTTFYEADLKIQIGEFKQIIKTLEQFKKELDKK